MSESVPVQKDQILDAIDKLVERKRPPRPGGDIYIRHLVGELENSVEIGLRRIIWYLANAGYDIEDILYFLYEVGLITTNDDVVRFRDAIRRVIMSKEE